MNQVYATYVFDCDGVVLDSNRLKTEAFRRAVLTYGEEAAQALVDHHVLNGGISRFEKFRYFFDKIAAPGVSGPTYEELLSAYTQAVRNGLHECSIVPGLERFRQATAGRRWLIVSGGSQGELREVFTARRIDHLFDGGIFGSPDNKDMILARELGSGNIQKPALFIGDSKYDYLAAAAAGLDFVFAAYWTEMVGWRAFTREHGLRTVDSINQV
ncbi:HAD family hydrolase [Altericroceibacterium xinjiangense]|uniref:HAD family hydrolase n=1 Tax=Altericroceibacterium xinjiangense TaxID=762261 RepID=UPI000F7D5DCD|nr:HAD-IA family hydrolase [Altericroceibacterium xinjiangense]